MTNHYRTLGVDPKADPVAIRSAYLALIRRHHPDSGEEADPARAQAVTAAWDVLRDPARRAAYDEGRQARFHPAASGGAAAVPTSRARGGAAARNLFLLLAAGTFALGWWALQQPLVPPVSVAETGEPPEASPLVPPAVQQAEDNRTVRPEPIAQDSPAPAQRAEQVAVNAPLQPPLPSAEPPRLPVQTIVAPRPTMRPAVAAARAENAGEVPKAAPSSAAGQRVDLAPLERHLQLLTDQSVRVGTEVERNRLFATREAFLKRLQDCPDDGCRRDAYLRRNVEVAEIMRN